MSDVAIQLGSVTKRFGKTAAVDRVSLSVRRGEVVGFVGANGAGKTTTIGLLMGFIRPTQGSVELFGSEVVPSNAEHSHASIGYAAGDMALFETMTGREYLTFVTHQTPGDHQRRYDELCERFDPQLDKKIRTLSRGNKQKIALIGAFVTRPKLVILDEPTSGLDPMMQEEFLSLVKDEQESGTTVFMSSHYLNEVMDVCTRIVFMKEGRVIHDMPIQELLAKGGRQVCVTTNKKPLKLPDGATNVRSEAIDGGVATRFQYNKSAATLLHWLAAQPGVSDVEITSYDPEDMFHSLYDEEAAE